MGEIVKNNLNKNIGASGVISIDGGLVNLLRKVGVSIQVGYANDVIGVSSSNISAVMGVEAANIDKVMGV